MSDWVSSMGGLALGSRFRRLSDYLSSEVAKVYKKLDIDLNPRHFPVLSLLHAHNQTGMSVTEIAEQLRISHVAVSSTVKSLEGQGYCSRRQHKKDERVTLIFLTKKAEQLISNELTPLWAIIRQVTEARIAAVSQGDFWDIISNAENTLTTKPLSIEILEEWHKTSEY